jgi:hypothetical protein
VHKKKKIYAYFLLSIYLLVIAHCHFSVDLLIQSGDFQNGYHFHEEEGEFYHSNEFHGDFFHFLGHIIEELRHVDKDDFRDEHIVTTSDFSVNKSANSSHSIDFIFSENEFSSRIISSTFLKGLPKYFNPFYRVLIKSNLPLRAPPVIIWVVSSSTVKS